jgi:hypothetical protein
MDQIRLKIEHVLQADGVQIMEAHDRARIIHRTVVTSTLPELRSVCGNEL